MHICVCVCMYVTAFASVHDIELSLYAVYVPNLCAQWFVYRVRVHSLRPLVPTYYLYDITCTYTKVMHLCSSHIPGELCNHSLQSPHDILSSICTNVAVWNADSMNKPIEASVIPTYE